MEKAQYQYEYMSTSNVICQLCQWFAISSSSLFIAISSSSILCYLILYVATKWWLIILDGDNSNNRVYCDDAMSPVFVPFELRQVHNSIPRK